MKLNIKTITAILIVTAAIVGIIAVFVVALGWTGVAVLFGIVAASLVVTWAIVTLIESNEA